MKTRTLIIAGAMFASAVSAQATKEIANLRQIEMGTAIASFPECPKKQRLAYASEEPYLSTVENAYPSEFRDKICFKKPGIYAVAQQNIATYRIDNLPPIDGSGREVHAKVMDGNVEGIQFVFSHGTKDSLYAALLDKYGQPTTTSIQTYRNGYGNTFQGTEAYWSGKSFMMIFSEYSNTINLGRLSMYSTKYVEMLLANKNTTTDQIRKGL